MSNQNDPQRTVQFFPNGGQPIRAKKIGRNDKCPCGSGKKAKFCHGVVTRYYDSRQD